MPDLRHTLGAALGSSRPTSTGLVAGAWAGGDEIALWHRGKLPAAARSIFEIGSVSKLFTATLLAAMAREGLLGIDDPVGRHLPAGVEMPSRGREITLADLSSHRSGLPGVPRELLLRAFTTDLGDPYARWDAAKLEAAIPRTRPRRAPEERFRYSNWAVGVLGHVLTLRAGMSYDELVRERICRPLAMHDTGVALDGGRLADGHSFRGRENGHWDLAALAGAGGLRSTAADLLAFLRMHGESARLGRAPDGGTALAEAARETHRVRFAAGRMKIGLGWMILPPSRRLRYELLLHEGGTGGFRTFAAVAPQAQTAVVVLSCQARHVGGLGMRLVRAAVEAER